MSKVQQSATVVSKTVETASTSSLAWNYTPTEGQGSFILQNTTDKDQIISSLSFTTNYLIDNAPWGEFPWDTVIKYTDNQDGTYTYQFTFPDEYNQCVIPASSSKSMTYNFDLPPITSALGIAMPPTQINVTDANGQIENVPISDINTTPISPVLEDKQSVSYYTSWAQYNGNKVTADQLPFLKITHIPYAFVQFDTEGNIQMPDLWSDSAEIPKLNMARQRYGHLNVALSFGGWGEGYNFAQMASNPAARSNFVKQSVAAIKQMGLNGIDLDWEYLISDTDADNFIALMQELTEEMQSQGIEKPYLSMAAPAGMANIKAISPEKWQALQRLATINIMTYDYYANWNQKASFNAPYKLSPNDPSYNAGNGECIYNTIKTYIEYAGLDLKKINPGLPAYVRGLLVSSTASTANYGLYQPILGVPRGEADNTGIWPNSAYYTTANSFKAINDLDEQIALQILLVDESKNIVGSMTTYDNAKSLAMKIKEDFGVDVGFMLWTVDNDEFQTPTNSVLYGYIDGLELNLQKSLQREKEDKQKNFEHSFFSSPTQATECEQNTSLHVIDPSVNPLDHRLLSSDESAGRTRAAPGSKKS